LGEEDDYSKLPISEDELRKRLISLSSTELGQRDKDLRKLATNPDYLRLKYWNTFFLIAYGFNKNRINNNLLLHIFMNKIKVEGQIIGIYGNSQIEQQSELARLTMATSDREKTDKKDMLDIGLGFKVKKDFTESSINEEQSKKLKDKQLKDETNELNLLKKEKDEMTKKIELLEKKQSIQIIYPQATNSEKKELDEKNKKEKRKKEEDNNYNIDTD
jgi:hypothetical protein